MSIFSRLSPQRIFVLRSRRLTLGEKKLAQTVFGQALRLDEIKIISHRLILKHYAMSPNGNIYFNEVDWRKDFSLESIEIQSWFIHELTHVWQVQTGLFAFKRALFDRRYQYILEAGKNFLEYGIEQQAQMVQDYFLRQHRGQDCQSLSACIPFLNQNQL